MRHAVQRQPALNRHWQVMISSGRCDTRTLGCRSRTPPLLPRSGAPHQAAVPSSAEPVACCLEALLSGGGGTYCYLSVYGQPLTP